MENHTYLPIGSVVMLKDQKRRVMIYGRRLQDKNGKKYDYLGCLYPEGYLNDGNVIVFNHDDIAMIFFIGFQDIEEIAFRKELATEIHSEEKGID